uniref:Biotin transporter BioY n=1 Tax=Ignisphaera aggregans TaxID=334771 RepID=A0A7J2U3Z3_9CREN
MVVGSITWEYARFVIGIAVAVLTGVLAQLCFWVGPIPYTFQNTGFVLAGLLLDPLHAFLSMALYMLFIVVGLPMAAGFRGGIHVVLGYTGGYIVGFIFSAPLMSLLKRWYLGRGRKLNELTFTEYLILLLLSLIAALPTYTLGFLVFACHALGSEKLFSWALKVASSMGISSDSKLLTLFIASVLVFIPQDMLMDHVIALILARYIYEIALYRGFDLS